jgi:hypothetical protein
MEEQNIRDLINDPARVGVMSTTDREGNPNVAVFGSPEMVDDITLVMALGETRTAQNLLETGKGVYMSVLADASDPMKTKGARIYLKVRTMEREGPNLQAMKKKIGDLAGPEAAARVRYAVIFDIESSRPLIDWKP